MPFSAPSHCLLDIEAEHTAFVARLADHHQDPFDRIIVAQALLEPMRLMTRDAIVSRYSDIIIKI